MTKYVSFKMENTQTLLRVAKIADLLKLTEVFIEYQKFYGICSEVIKVESYLRHRLVNKDSQIFIVENHQKEILGFLQIYFTLSSLRLDRALILNDLFVVKAFRKQGIAVQLIQATIDFAKEQQVSYIELETGVENSSAQVLYEKMGLKKQDVLTYTIDCK